MCLDAFTLECIVLKTAVSSFQIKRVHDVTVFTSSYFYCLHGDGNSISFKNVHFEAHFLMFPLLDPKNGCCHVNE